MTTKIGFLLVFAIAISLVGSAYAHKSEVVGDYKIEIGWKNEPPVAGIDNEITLTVTNATAFDKAEAEKEDQVMEGMDMGHSHSDSKDSMNHDEMDHGNMVAADIAKGNTGARSDTSGKDMTSSDTMKHNIGQAATTGTLKGFSADVMLGDNDYPLNLVEDAKYLGVYHAKFTPTETGYPMVHISGKLVGEDTNITFHPEQVEALNTMRPLQQIENGINPEDVQCKEGYDSYMRVSDGSALCLKPAGGEKLMLLGLVEFF